ncbi:unnamed protein product [Durusdinium trenchii]|uniref:Armadillo repeat-containing protein 8 n=1 Tax=Durusdinium trenchii TaxID=1381693 RepID=A0ABP0HED1_9DINO
MLRYSDPQHLAVLLIRGAIERLVFLLETASREVQARACHALQRVACASTRGMQALLVCEPLPALKEMMESEDPAVQLEGTVLVANTIAFGGPHVEEVLKIGCVPLLLECLRGREETYPETRRAAARGLCALNKRAPQPELWEAPMVAAVLGALPSDASALDFLVSVLRLTPGDLSQKLREAACAFLENCGLDDSLQGQVQEALLLLQETQGERA